MSIYFVFSDESGLYKTEKSPRFIQRNPYYCRSTTIINSDDWKKLRDGFCALKTGLLKIKILDEVKYSHLWRIKQHEDKKTAISKDKDYYFLRKHSHNELLKFADESLALLNECKECYQYFTVTFNTNTPKISEEKILKMHLQNIMQRVQYQIESKKSNLGVLFLDSVNEDTDKKLKYAYQQFFHEDCFVDNYKNIVDSNLIDFSHHNTGLQLADFCAGVFLGFLRGYQNSTMLFKNRIWQNIRSKRGKVIGYGISNIPSTIIENTEILKNKIIELKK